MKVTPERLDTLAVSECRDIVRISSGDSSLMGTQIVVTHRTEGDEDFFNISWQQEGFLPHEMVVVREDQDGEVECLHRCGCGGYGEEEKIEGNASHRLTAADRKTGEPPQFSKDEMLNWIVTSLGEHNTIPNTPKETADYLRGHKVEEWDELMPCFFDGGAVGFVEGVTDALAKKKSWSGVPRQRCGEPAKFSLDHSPSFDGFTWGDTWNGWACPAFTKEVAYQIIHYLNGSNQDYDPNIPTSYFDEATKEFVIYMLTDDPQSEPERHAPYPKGAPAADLYGIGSHNWCWWRDDEAGWEEVQND